MYCRKCGNLMSEGDRICSKCGLIYEEENSSVVTEKTSSEISALDTNPMVKKKNTLIIAAVVCLLVLIIGGFVIWKVFFSGPKVDFQEVYNECELSRPWATVGGDGSYLKIDTSPNNADLDDMTYDQMMAVLEAIDAIERVNDELGLPSYLYDDMTSTTALQGRQTEEFDEIGIEVTWTYSRSNGLEVTYRLQ